MFSTILDELLTNSKVSAYRLAKETGMSQTVICQYRSGKSLPTADKLLLIADFFGVSTDYLLGREAGSVRAVSADKLTDSEREILRALRENPGMETPVRLLLRLPVSEEPAKRA